MMSLPFIHVYSKIDELEAQDKSLRSQRSDDQLKVREKEEESRALGNDVRDAKRILREAEQAKANVLNNSNNPNAKMMLLSPHMMNIMDRIKNTRFQGVVVGPVGAYVKLTPEASRSNYGLPVERVIGRFLSNFLVSCKEDQYTLSNIIKSFNADNITVVKFSNGVKYTRLADIQRAKTIASSNITTSDLVFNG